MSLKTMLESWWHKDVVVAVTNELAALHARIDALEERMGLRQTPPAQQSVPPSEPPAQ